MLRSVAIALNNDLLECDRTSIGYPKDTLLAAKEIEEADELRRRTAQLWQENKSLYESHARDLNMKCLWDDEFSSIDERLEKMKKNDTYGAEPEILSLVHVIKRPVHVYYHGGFDKFTEFGEAFTESPPIRVVNYPDRRRGQPGHYDLLLTTQDKSEQPL